jgi:hypothetical protein
MKHPTMKHQVVVPDRKDVSLANSTSVPELGRERGVTGRVVVLCLGLAMGFGYIMPIIDYNLKNTFLGATHLPPGAIGVLLILLLVVNPLLTLLSNRLRFSRNEILTVYCSCLFSSLVPGHGGENYVIPTLIAPFYFATRENKNLEFLQPYVEPWMTPALTSSSEYNRPVVESWYMGLRAGESIPWGAWLVPLFAWGSFILVSYAMLGCLSVMLRAQWAEREALAFPLLKLPVQMTEDVDHPEIHGVVGRFFRSPMMWCGFGVAVFIQMMRGLNTYFPDVPTIPLSLEMGPLLSEAPWNQTGWMQLHLFPIAVGISYLLTSEVSFSLWFFFFFIKLQYLVAYYSGYMPNSLPSFSWATKVFTGFQVAGCYLVFATGVLWVGREHFLHIARRAFGRTRARAGESEEALSYPAAFWGFTVCFALMVAWSCAAGVRIDIAIVLWICYLVMAIALTRVIVEGGLVFVSGAEMPLTIISRLLNTSGFSWLTTANGVVPAAFLEKALVGHMRGFIMPSFMHSFKLVHDHKIAARPLLGLLAVVILISLSMSLWMNVRLGYEHGGLQLGNQWFATQSPVERINALRDPSPSATTDWVNWFWLGFGAVVTYGLMWARARFAGFPLHPIGYVMCLSYPMYMFWFSIFSAGYAKGLIMRFGGIDVYRKVTPAFLGLVLGDVSMMLFWLAIDGWQGRTGHQLMPG